MATLEYKTVDGSSCIHSYHVCKEIAMLLLPKILACEGKTKIPVVRYTVTLDTRNVVGHSVTGIVQEPSHTSKPHDFVRMQ